jgi:hypothetical protein
MNKYLRGEAVSESTAGMTCTRSVYVGASSRFFHVTAIPSRLRLNSHVEKTVRSSTITGMTQILLPNLLQPTLGLLVETAHVPGGNLIPF